MKRGERGRRGEEKRGVERKVKIKELKKSMKKDNNEETRSVLSILVSNFHDL